MLSSLIFFFSSRRRHTRSKRDWSSDVCSSDLGRGVESSGPLLSTSLLALDYHGDVAAALTDVESTTLSARTETTHGRALVGVCLGDDQGARIQTKVVLCVSRCGGNNLGDVLGSSLRGVLQDRQGVLDGLTADQIDHATCLHRADAHEARGGACGIHSFSHDYRRPFMSSLT